MTQTANPDERIIESCLFCNVKVRIHPAKVLLARCPQCKGPIGDPKLDQKCDGCAAVNRVLRSRLAAARCGKCKEPLHRGQVPRDLLIADLYATIGGIFGDSRLSSRRSRPHDLVDAVALLEEMPQVITEIAANMDPGPDRDKLAALAGRCKSLPAKVRPLAFEQSAVLHNDLTVEQYMLEDAFEVLRRHPAGFDFLRRARRGDPGATSAREELACAKAPFEKLMDRFHRPNWKDPADRQVRQLLAEKVFAELAKVLEVWMPRPYRFEAMLKAGMNRLAELPETSEVATAQSTAIRDEVAAFYAITTAGVARAVVYHGLAEDPKQAWPRIQQTLHAGLLNN